MISGKFVMIDYDINCLKIYIDVLCDAWLILALIYLLSRQLTPWHFFPGFEHFEVRQVHVHCSKSLKVGANET